MEYPTLEQLYDIFSVTSGVNTDTRTIEPDQLFIALKGENFNGNAYADEALQKGALYAIVDEEKYATSYQHILVKDGLETLQKLARFHRKMLDLPVIGITGSNGKTTTKELIAAVLSMKYNCFYTKGNLNNHIGVPLSVLSITPEHEIAVIEMGANHLGEIAQLCKYCRPDYGLITNIGTAHIEGFGSRENVKIAKGELFDYLRKKKNKAIFVNADDEVLMSLTNGLETITYGKEDENMSGSIFNDSQFLKLKIEDKEQAFTIETNLVGNYNFYNALAAATIGRHFEVPLLDVVEAIQEYVPKNNRSQFLEKDGYQFIVDAYNANPSSMKVAIENLATHKNEKTFAVLGHMLELGSIADEEHDYIATLLVKQNINALLVGQGFEQAAKKHHFPWVKDSVTAKEWFFNHVEKDTTVLLKGSRGIKLEKILATN